MVVVVKTYIGGIELNGLGLVLHYMIAECSNSSALAMELLQSCTKPSIYIYIYVSRNLVISGVDKNLAPILCQPII